MGTDRRTASRHAMRGLAKIQPRAGALPRDCMITDVSDGGVRLYAESHDIPDEFILSFVSSGVRRDCRVVWRLGHELGAEFVDRKQDGFAYRMTG